jgi:hypothetical protein
MILENIGEEVAELTTNELIEELGLKPDSGAQAMFSKDAIVVENVIVTRDELEERLSTQRWEEYPDGPI